MKDEIFEEYGVIEVSLENGSYQLEPAVKKVIAEISLKVYVNNDELVSLLCLNRQQEELALGFLYNEGVINRFEDIEECYYNERGMAVIINLKPGISIKRQESLRSITSGCGKCYTYINPLKHSQYKKVEADLHYTVAELLERMKAFAVQSDVFRQVGGVHSLLFYTPEYTVFSEDIGRHNCFDKVTGMLLREGKLELAEKGIVFISGRVSSEIITKVIRLGAPVIVSRSAPTTAAVRLANQYNVTLIGYARQDTCYIYSGAERIVGAPALPSASEEC